MTFSNILAGDPLIASVVMANFKHVNFGSDLVPVNASGIAVDNTLNFGSALARWQRGYFVNAYFSEDVAIGAQIVSSLGTNITTLGIRGKTTDRTGGIYFDSSDSSVNFAIYGATTDSATLPFSIGTRTNHGFRFIANNSSVGCINSVGNFGIGTTAPSYKLDVQSGFGVLARFNFNDGTFNPKMLISGSNAGVTFNLDYSSGASNILFSIAGTECFRANSSGVGIGTSTVSAKLTVISAGATSIFRAGYDGSNYLDLSVGATGNATFSLKGISPAFLISNRIEISPAQISGIQEAIRLVDYGSGSAEGVYIRWDSASRVDMARISGFSESIGGGLAFYTNSANSGNPQLNAYLTASGNLGIGTTTTSAKIHAVSVGEQFRFGYDVSNYGSISANASGLISIGGSSGVVSIANQHKAKLYKTTSQSIPTSSDTVVTFDAEEFDTGGLHSTVSNTERITAVYDGNYIFVSTVEFNMAAQNLSEIVFRKNGAKIRGGHCMVTGNVLNISAIIPLVAGDYVDVVAAQYGGDTFSIGVQSTLEAIKLS